MILTGWGRWPQTHSDLHKPRTEQDLRDLVVSQNGLVARGQGRAYGDSAVGHKTTLSMTHFNHMIAFDPASGRLDVEAGVTLGEIIQAFLPQGWFPAVTPGTQFVSVGGAIAADVHGKNHHKDGSFRTCVEGLDLMDHNGDIHRVTPEGTPELFDRTLGGMGLTGVVLRATIRLKRVETGWIRQTTHPTHNLQDTLDIFEQTQNSTYSVAWIDCLASGHQLGRSLVMVGEHASLCELSPRQRKNPHALSKGKPLTWPIDLPSMALNRHTVRAFNRLYHWNGTRKAETQMVGWKPFFYPLDGILKWNRLYGRKGFAQFQCVLPLDRSQDGLKELLNTISKAEAGSFLAVLKRLGPQDSALSFPMEGHTLALDFPMSAKTLELMNRLDAIVVAHGGRFYLAKDSRMSRDTLHTSDPRAAEFARHRQENHLSSRFSSHQSERLSL